MARGKVTALKLLDLSAALNTVVHTILLHRLDHWFGITSIELNWFQSYLQNHPQRSLSERYQQ